MSPFEFGSHRHTGIRDLMIFICHVTLQDHVIRNCVMLSLGAHQDKSPSYQVWWP